MSRTSLHPKVDSIIVGAEPATEAAFSTATAAEQEARRQSRVLAECAADPASDEAEVMRWIEDVMDAEGWSA